MNSNNNQFLTKISDIEINFPYQPYEIQINYMSKVIESLDKGNNNISALESPTGTGKTLCLLCSVLSWVNKRKKENKFLGKIFYASRTHSQLSNIIKELNKTNYKPKISILSSRLHSCINNQIYKDEHELLNIKCNLLKEKSCEYYKNINKISKENNDLNLIDIEELCKYGKIMKFCPYYYEKEKSKSAELILLPYNYIFDSEIRKKFNIYLNNNILIIDEAHNICNICEDEKSYEISQTDYESILIDLRNISKKINMKNSINNSNVGKYDELNKVINIIENLKLNLIKLKDVKNLGECYPQKGRLLKFEEVLNYLFFNLFDENDLNNSNNNNNNSNENNNLDFNNQKLNNFIKILTYFEVIFQDKFENTTKITLLIKIIKLFNSLILYKNKRNLFNFYIYDDLIKQKNSKKCRIFKIFCFDASICFYEIIKNTPHCLILTSGTLSPINYLEKQLKIDFYIKLFNNHYIKEDQIKFDIIKKINNQPFIFDFKNRTTEIQINNLSEMILLYCKILNKGNIIVFFSSYSYLNLCFKEWKKNRIILEINKYKQIFLDSKESKKELIQSFINNNNSILFSIFRGNSSEGIDFADDNARIIILVGIPYANLLDTKVVLKKRYLDIMGNKTSKYYMNGNDWYKNEAIIAVNQSLGRVIRHVNDYGLLICIDIRFEEFKNQKLFSFWLNKYSNIIEINDKKKYEENIKQFFENNESKELNNLDLTSLINNFDNLILNGKSGKDIININEIYD